MTVVRTGFQQDNRRVSHGWSYLFAILAMCASLPYLTAADDPPLTLGAEAPWHTAIGNLPVLVTARNRSNDPLTVRLSLQSGSQHIAKEVQLAALEQQQFWMPLNPGAGRWASVNGRVDGYSNPAFASINMSQLSIAVLDPRSQMPAPLLQTMEKVVNDTYSSHHHGSVNFSVSPVRPELIPPHALWIPPDLFLLVSEAGWAALNPHQRLALSEWSRWGGVLLCAEEGLYQQWRSAGLHPYLLLDGALTSARIKDQQAVIDQDVLQRFSYETTAGQRSNIEFKTLVNNHGFLSSQDESIEHGGPHWMLPGTEQQGRVIIGIMVLIFFILAGPGAVWWTKRRGQPWRLLFIAPLLGLGACVLLIAVDVLSLGLDRDRQVVELTVLDSEHNRALVGQGIASFGGFSLGRLDLAQGSQLSEGRRVYDAWDTYSYFSYRNRRYRREIPPWTTTINGLLRHRGRLLPARDTGHIAILQSIPERRRLALYTSPEGDLFLENDLGVAIRAAHWLDSAGKWWQCADLAPGQRKILHQGLPIHQAQHDLFGVEGFTDHPFSSTSEAMQRLPWFATRHWQARRGQVYVRLEESLHPLANSTGQDSIPPLALLTTQLAAHPLPDIQPQPPAPAHRRAQP